MSLQYVEDFARPDLDQQDRKTKNDIVALKWHPHGAVFAGSIYGELTAWEATTGHSILISQERIHSVGLNSITISKDGSRMLTSSLDGTVALWDTSALAKSTAAIRRASTKEDGSANGGESSQQNAPAVESNAVKLHQVVVLQTKLGLRIDENGQGINGSDADTHAKVAIDSSIFSTALHPVEPFFVSTGLDANVTIHEAGDDNFGAIRSTIDGNVGEKFPKQRQEGHSEPNYYTVGISIAFNQLGDLLAVGTQHGAVLIYDLTTQKGVDADTSRGISARMAIRCLTFTRDDRLLIGCDDGTVTICIINTETQLERCMASQSQSQGQSQTRLYRNALISSQLAPISDETTLRRQVNYARSWNAHSGFVTAIKLSEDERIAATSDLGGHVKLWDTTGSGNTDMHPLWTSNLESEVWTLDWQKSVPPQDNIDGDDGIGAGSASASMMTAAASSAYAAARFVTASGDGVVRWFRAAGSGNA